MRHQYWIVQFMAHELKGLLYAIVLAFLVQWTEYAGWFASIEGRVQDLLLYGGITRSRGTAFENKVVTVEIDDYAYSACFGSKSPLDPYGVTDLVAAIAQAGPAVIGVDILTNPEIEQYAAAYRNLWDNPRTRVKVPVVWVADLKEPLTEPRAFWKWLWGQPEFPEADPSGLLGFNMHEVEERKILWGLPVYPLEEDLGVRSLPRRFVQKHKPPEIGKPQEEKMPGFAYRVAKTYCDLEKECQVDTTNNQVFVSYAGGPPPAFTVRQIFRCTPENEPPPLDHLSTGDLDRMLAEEGLHVKGPGVRFGTFKDQAIGNIVLIGGTFGAARDTYFTPAGRIAGLALNAYAVESELAGRSVKDTWRAGILMVDILIGWLIVFFFWPPAIKLPMSRKILYWARLILVGLIRLPIELLVRWPRIKSRMEIRRNNLKTFALVRHNEIRWMIAASLSLLIFTFFASLLAFYLGYLWLTWIGVLIGMGPHVIIEILSMNPRVHEDGEESRHGGAGTA